MAMPNTDMKKNWKKSIRIKKNSHVDDSDVHRYRPPMLQIYCSSSKSAKYSRCGAAQKMQKRCFCLIIAQNVLGPIGLQKTEIIFIAAKGNAVQPKRL